MHERIMLRSHLKQTVDQCWQVGPNPVELAPGLALPPIIVKGGIAMVANKTDLGKTRFTSFCTTLPS